MHRREQPRRCSTRSASAPRSSARAGAELRRVALMRGDETIVARAAAPATARIAGAGRSAASISTRCSPTPPQAAGATRPAACGAAVDRRQRRRLRAEGPIGRRAAGGDVELRAGLVVAAHGSWEPLPSRARGEPRHARRRPTCSRSRPTSRRRDCAPTCCPCCRSPAATAAWSSPTTAWRRSPAASAPTGCRRLRAAQPGARAGDVFEAMLRARMRAASLRRSRGATREGPWLASGPLRPGVRLGAGSDDGVFRVGNAAGEAHPIVGEGISMALQSAFVLAALIGPAARAPWSARRRAAAQAARAGRLRSDLAAPLLAAPARRRGVRPRRDAACARRARPGRWLRRWPGVLTLGARLSDKTRCAPEARACRRGGMKEEGGSAGEQRTTGSPRTTGARTSAALRSRSTRCAASPSSGWRRSTSASTSTTSASSARTSTSIRSGPCSAPASSPCS